MRYRLFFTLFSVFSANAIADAALLFVSPGNVIAEDIEVQTFHGEWFAIHQANGNWYLSKTKITTSTNRDSDIIELRTKYKNAVGLLKDKNLVEGQLESATLMENKQGNARSFIFRQKKYSLVVKPIKFKYHSPQHNQTFDNVRNDVYFSDGHRSILVYGGAKTDQSSKQAFVEWAGDIDRDGNPDFIAYFDDDSEKNALRCVFLSGKAKSGKLIGQPACQFFSG